MICSLCERDTPLIEYHHTIPRSCGGENSRTEVLCQGCHKLIHSIADMIIHNKTDKAKSIIESLNYNQNQLSHFSKLVKTIVQARTLKREGKLSPSVESITIKLDPILKAKLHTLSRDMKMSLEDLVVSILRSYSERRL